MSTNNKFVSTFTGNLVSSDSQSLLNLTLLEMLGVFTLNVLSFLATCDLDKRKTIGQLRKETIQRS